MANREQHDWNREDNRKQNRREDRSSHDRRSFSNKENRGSFKQKDKSFDHKDRSFEGRERRFDDRERRFDKREKRFDDKERRFDNKSKSFDNKDRSFNDNERSFDDYKRRDGYKKSPSRYNKDVKGRSETKSPRRVRAFDEYKIESDPTKRQRIRRNAEGERVFRKDFSQDKSAAARREAKDGVRLNKYVANAGICSRREADVLITTGVIKVNDEVITTLGYRVKPEDVVKYNGRVLRNEKKIYILLNKPKGYITTSDDPRQRKTVMELIDGACRERVYPVGRLDRMTTGLLLFTNDGELTKKLTHPSFGAQKVYNAELDHPLTKEDIDKLLEGVELEDGFMKVDDINYLDNTPIDRKKVGVSIHSGRNRIIRRLFESLGYEVKKLDRVYFAGLTKKNLMRGQWRFLTEQEIGFLHMQR